MAGVLFYKVATLSGVDIESFVSQVCCLTLTCFPPLDL